MKKQLFIMLFSVSLAGAAAQSFDEAGFEMATRLRPNVVRIDAGYELGFGVIVALRRDVAYVVVPRNMIMKTDRVKIDFFGSKEGKLGRIDNKLQYENLALLTADVPSDFEGWKREFYSERALPNSRFWYIGRKGEWFVPTGSLTGAINDVSPSGRMQIDVPYNSRESVGTPIITEDGIVGLITEAYGKETWAISMKEVKRIVTDFWRQPFELITREQGSNSDKCELTLKYTGYGRDMRGNELPMRLLIKSLSLNGRQIFINPKEPYPVKLPEIPCGNIVYELEAEVTNGVQVWQGRGRGNLMAQGELFINWAMNSSRTVTLELK